MTHVFISWCALAVGAASAIIFTAIYRRISIRARIERRVAEMMIIDRANAHG